jgi:hypothetical protein
VTWPRWHVTGEPLGLAKYVQPDAVADHLVLPGPGDADPVARLHEVFGALRKMGIRYAFEAVSDDPARQVVRTPEQVLWAPRHATCLDLAVTFAGAALVAGLHPIIIILGPSAASPVAHAVVGIWFGDDAEYPPPDDGGYWSRRPEHLDGLIQTDLDDPAELIVVDPVAVAMSLPGTVVEGTGLDLAEAVRRGAEAVATRPWQVGIDIGRLWRRQDCLPYAGRPPVEPLRPPYVDPDPEDGPLRLIRAEYGLVPFESRDELVVAEDFCRRTVADGRTGLLVLAGRGGAGKTRLALELARLLGDEGWYAGLPRPGVSPEATAWLGRVTSPTLVVVDYADANPAAAKSVLDVFQARRATPGVLVMTARSTDGEWLADVQAHCRDNGLPVNVKTMQLPSHHPDGAAVLRNAYRALAGPDRTPPAADILAHLTLDRFTTLDFVLLAWFTVGNGAPPADMNELYNTALQHEQSYWRRTWRRLRADVEAPGALIRQAAALVTVLGPAPVEAEINDCLRGLADAGTDRRYDIARTLGICLRSVGDERLAVRPDPVGDFLVLEQIRLNSALFSGCLDNVERRRALLAFNNLNRVGHRELVTIAAVMADAVRRRPELWDPLLGIAYLQAGAALQAMLDLAGQEETSLPLDEISSLAPPHHPALWQLGLIVDQRRLDAIRAQPDADPAELAGLISTVAVRLAKAGDAQAALSLAEESVRHTRALALDEPVPYCELLARTLSNLSNRQSSLGEHQAAVVSATEAAGLERALADESPHADTHDLTVALDILAARQYASGDPTSALVTSSEALQLHATEREKARADHHRRLAFSLYSRSDYLVAAGNHEKGLDAAVEAVSVARAAMSADTADGTVLAEALRALFRRQQAVGDPAAAATTADELLGLHRDLAAMHPAMFLSTLIEVLIEVATLHSVLGRHDLAVAQAEQAAETAQTRRNLGTAESLTCARVLHGSAQVLARAGRTAAALAAANESVAVHREHGDNPPHRRMLAVALGTLADQQVAADDHHGALHSAREAEGILRSLAGPERDLALVLLVVGRGYDATGDPDAALAAIQDGTQLLRTAAETDIEAVVELCGALYSLSFWQQRHGLTGEAMTTLLECDTRLRQLPNRILRQHLPQRAMISKALAQKLHEAGDTVSAARALEDACQTYRKVAATNPTEYTPKVAQTLKMLTDLLVADGSPDVALRYIAEAVELYRQLTAVDPDTHASELAGALNALSYVQSVLGYKSAAHATTQEAVGRLRALAGRHSDQAGELAVALNNLANRLAEREDDDEALKAATEATAIQRQITEDDTTIENRTRLADFLRNETLRRVAAGQHEPALDAIREALTHYCSLAADGTEQLQERLAATLHLLAELENG